jgi:preprotein translocase subunit YajC
MEATVLELAQIAATSARAPGMALPQILLMVGFIAIMYFILIRPAHKRQKALQQMQDSLQSGARVVTSGGLKGTIVKVEKDTIKLRIADNVKVDVTRSSIVGVEAGSPTSESGS